jgi:hypothetical protein
VPETVLWAIEPGPASAFVSILYRCGMNKKIGRNFEVFTPCDSIAAITQHIPNKSFQLVRYYGWWLIDEEDFHRAHPAPSRAPARGGGRAIRHRPAGQNDPRSMARRPLPDYDTEPVMAFSAT